MAIERRITSDEVHALIARLDGGVVLPVERAACGRRIPPSGVAELLGCVALGDEYAADSALHYLGLMAKSGRLSAASRNKVVRFLMPIIEKGLDPADYLHDGPDGEKWDFGGNDAVRLAAIAAIGKFGRDARVALPILCGLVKTWSSDFLYMSIAWIVAGDPEILEAIARLSEPSGDDVGREQRQKE